MKIAVISDTHGLGGWRIPDCDVFVHAGDMTAYGRFKELRALAERFASLSRVGHVLLVPGNHDRCFQTEEAAARALFPANVQVLIDQAAVIDGVRFYGSPWTPVFQQWAFMEEETALAERFASIPSEIDLLITHGPPYGILDPGWREEHAGSHALRKTVFARSIRRHVFGHLHAAGGQTAIWKSRELGPSSLPTTLFSNVAACDDSYVLCRQPLEIDL